VFAKQFCTLIGSCTTNLYVKLIQFTEIPVAEQLLRIRCIVVVVVSSIHVSRVVPFVFPHWLLRDTVSANILSGRKSHT